MKYILFLCWLPCTILLLSSCKSQVKNLASKSASGNFQAVIEIPAGTNLKLEMDKADGKIKPDQLNGKDRVIDFLGYPGNYGFIPGTMMSEGKGGDGDAIDVLVIGQQMASGTVLDILPIATLKLMDQGELDTKIIAVPTDPQMRTMDLERFSTLITKYHMAQQIIQNWFLSYKGMGKTELLGWEDGGYAIKEIESWTQK